MKFGKCKKCKKEAVIAINAGKISLCAYHYVKQEDEECLKAFLLNDIEQFNKIKLDKEIQKQIKKQKPKLYEQLKDYFEV